MTRAALVAMLALVAIAAHLVLVHAAHAGAGIANSPLIAILIAGGTPLVVRLAARGARGEFGSDHLAGVSIVASALLGEYLAGAIVVLMLTGGETLEQYAVAEATS